MSSGNQVKRVGEKEVGAAALGEWKGTTSEPGSWVS